MIIPSGALSVIGAVVAPVLMIGCAAIPDPHDGGLRNGVIGVVGGGYSRRIEARRQTYAGLTAEQEALIAEADRLENERRELRGELGQVESELSRLESELRRKQALVSRAQRHPDRPRALGQADERIRISKTRARAASSDEVPLADMRRELDALRQELSDIDELIQDVSQDAS